MTEHPELFLEDSRVSIPEAKRLNAETVELIRQAKRRNWWTVAISLLTVAIQIAALVWLLTYKS